MANKNYSLSPMHMRQEKKEYSSNSMRKSRGEGAASHEGLESKRVELAERKALMGKKKAIKQYKDTLNKPGSQRNDNFDFNRNEKANERWIIKNDYAFNSYSDYMRRHEP